MSKRANRQKEVQQAKQISTMDVWSIYNDKELPTDSFPIGKFLGDIAESSQQGATPDRPTLPIDKLLPDVEQARRAIPSTLRPYSKDSGIGQFLLEWCHHTPLDVDNILTPEKDTFRAGKMSAEEEALYKIVSLAASILRDGLTNPITVHADQDTLTGLYYIETGERRWLAYQLLNAIFPDGTWSNIPVKIVPELSVWRQASENSARDDLNAIGKARQLALLLMDVYGGDNFNSIVEFETEQEFYAQVADSEQYRIPYGQSEKFCNALGLKNPVQLRQYRDILRIDPELWNKADDENWTEFEIRKFPKTVESVTHVTDSTPKWKKDTYTVLRQYKKAKPEERAEMYDHLRYIISEMKKLGFKDE